MAGSNDSSIQIVPHRRARGGEEVALKATVRCRMVRRKAAKSPGNRRTTFHRARRSDDRTRWFAVGAGSAMVTAAGGGVTAPWGGRHRAARGAGGDRARRPLRSGRGGTVTCGASTEGKHGAGLERSVTWSSTDHASRRSRAMAFCGDREATGTVTILAHCDGVRRRLSRAWSSGERADRSDGRPVCYSAPAERTPSPPGSTPEPFCPSPPARPAQPALPLYLALAAVTVVLVGGALLAWALLRPPAAWGSTRSGDTSTAGVRSSG